MRALFADSNRDMLFAYRRLMEIAGIQTETAFDGVQTLDFLETRPFDLAIVNERLPRIPHERMIRLLREKGVPVIVLLDAPVSVKRLCREELPNAYLSFPFFSSELFALAENVLKKAHTVEDAEYMGIRVNLREFRFSDTDIRLTAGEIDALTQFSGQGPPPAFEKRMYAHSLNQKLKKLDKPALRVEYRENQGYRLVNRNE